VEVEESKMSSGRARKSALALAVLAGMTLASCGRRKADINDVVPSFTANQARVPLGSAIETTFTFTTGPQFKKIAQEFHPFVHFLDSHNVVLFAESYVPPTPVTGWEPGKAYTEKHTVFVPVYPYVGDVTVVMGLAPAAGRGERVALKGEDVGLRAYKVAKLELLPQTENIFLVYKEGWHSPEASAANPSLERTWTKKDALVSFKNPKKDIVIYLEADTNFKAFAQPPVLTLAVAGKAGVKIPIENAEVFLRKIRVKADYLGTEEWSDLRFSLNQSFVPKALGLNQDDRELGIMVYHLYVGEADKLGEMSGDGVLDAEPMPDLAKLAPLKPSPAPSASAKPSAPGKGAGAKRAHKKP
jgi:hypothetical protein